MKKLPVGIQTLGELIAGGYVYADKTKYIYDLLEVGKYYFLSRPRRFGKSLLVDTMRELFLGNRELFKGLWIDSSDYSFTAHPVVRLDMSQMSLHDPAMLDATIRKELLRIADTYKVSVENLTLESLFTDLISGLRTACGERVVVLIDEYDKPVIDHINNPQLARANRAILSSFYGVLKGQDANLHFVFLTGVSKFTRLSVFSQLNNLTDLTLWKPYAGICGFTEAEFDALFSEHLAAYQKTRVRGSFDGDESLASVRNEVFAWYDGYTWDATTRVFNPFSLLSFFLKGQYNNYWYASGIPKFLADAFKERPQSYFDIQGAIITETLLDSHDIEDAPLVSLLFQTGFLTVKSIYEGQPARYSLGFPNSEVAQSCSQLFLTNAMGEQDPYGNTFNIAIQSSLDEGRPEAIAEPLRSLFASIPYQLHIPAEAFYRSIFLAVMQFSGFRIQGELSVSTGRIDGIIERFGKTYVIEFKYLKTEDDIAPEKTEALLEAALADALAQIEAKHYADRYEGTGQQVYKVAIAISGRGGVQVRATT